MIKLEMHCHTFNTSSCANTPNDIIISKYVEKGYGGIVVTNHFDYNSYINYMEGQTHEQKVESFFNAIEDFSNECKKANLKCFWGVEVKTNSGVEYLVIGLDKNSFLKKPLFEYSQQELFSLAESQGAFMYQTHPFRQGVIAGDPKYLHGAESFNGHYHHINNNDKALEFCVKNHLIGLSGTDYHHPDQPVTAGIYIREDIFDNKDLVKYLFENKFELIKEEQTYLEELKRYKGV